MKSNDISCNVNGNKIPSGVETVPAKEGDTIKVQWDSSSHPGPITHFLYGPVDDAANTAGFGAGWFKINEFDREGDKWANEIMESQNMTYEFKLPTGLQSGEYLVCLMLTLVTYIFQMADDFNSSDLKCLPFMVLRPLVEPSSISGVLSSKSPELAVAATQGSLFPEHITRKTTTSTFPTSIMASTFLPTVLPAVPLQLAVAQVPLQLLLQTPLPQPPQLRHRLVLHSRRHQ